MPRYLDMLRAKGIFGGGPDNRRPLGMPESDNESFEHMFQQVHPMVNMLKREDMARQKEMMNFENSLRQRQQPVSPNTPVMPMKKNVIQGGVQPNAMQERFRQEDAAKKAQAHALTMQSGALANTSALNKQRDDADMARTVADINGRADVAKSNRASVEKAADDARTDKERTDAIARTQKGPLVNVPHPVTGKMESRQYNPVTRKYEGITIDDSQAGTGYKQGTIPKPTINPGQDPVKLAAIRKQTQSTMDELDELLDPKTDTLRSHAGDATGASGMLGKWSENLGVSALTPETTRGRAGIKALKGKLVIDLIAQMKAQSKTGATGFGAMNKAELALLEASASKLDPNLADEAFAAELRKIRKNLQLIMQDAQGESSGGSSGSSDAEKRADELGRKNGWW